MNRLPLILLLLSLACLLTPMSGNAQVSDTLNLHPDSISEQKQKVKRQSIFSGKPGKSLLFSLIVPGSGQAYNKSYLRIPFVYAAIGGAGYYLHYNSLRYRCVSDAYKAAVDNVPHTITSKCRPKNLENITDPATLRYIRDEYNQQRQLAIIVFALTWLANGIDAYVDSHLKSFDMNESLSIEAGPISDDDPNMPFRFGLVVKF